VGILIIKVEPKNASGPSTRRRRIVLFTRPVPGIPGYERPRLSLPVKIVGIIVCLLIAFGIRYLGELVFVGYWYISVPTVLILAALGWLKGERGE
jgi:hypothetical protein